MTEGVIHIIPKNNTISAQPSPVPWYFIEHYGRNHPMTDAPLIAALHARAKEAEAAAYDAQTDRGSEAHTAVLAAVELLIASIDALAFVEGPYVPG